MNRPVEIRSFGYLHSPPPPAAVTVDLRELLPDPSLNPALRGLTGHEAPVRYAVLNSRGAAGLIAHLTMLVTGLFEANIPATLAVGCVDGQRQAVVVADDIASRLRLAGWPVELRHRDLDRPSSHGSEADVTGELCP